MQPYIEETQLVNDTFAGVSTKRTGALVARSKASWAMVGHQLLMDVCAGVLGHQLLYDGKRKQQEGEMAPGYVHHPWQLHLTQIIQIGAGEPAQPLHRDHL